MTLLEGGVVLGHLDGEATASPGIRLRKTHSRTSTGLANSSSSVSGTGKIPRLEEGPSLDFVVLLILEWSSLTCFRGVSGDAISTSKTVLLLAVVQECKHRSHAPALCHVTGAPTQAPMWNRKEIIANSPVPLQIWNRNQSTGSEKITPSLCRLL